MSTLKLPRLALTEDKPGKYQVQLDSGTNADFLLYLEAYRETYGESITADSLVAWMIRYQIAADRGFQRWKKSRTLVTPRRGNPRESAIS
jgi:hypothetical protein